MTMRVLIRSVKEMCVKTHTLWYKCVCVSSPSLRHSHRTVRGNEGGFTGEPGGGEHVGGEPGGGEHVGGEPGGGEPGGGERAWMCGSSEAVLSAVRGDVQVLQNFISEEEEAALLRELEPGLRRKRYEFDHWDNAIHGFRETERLQWGGGCASVLERLRAAAFPEGTQLLGPVHVLDLDKAGFIKAHVDSVKFCGSTIAGVSLLSDSVMRLVHVDNSAIWVDLLLRRRSLYILRNEVRFKFTHEILKDDESYFSGQRIPRQRRISVICRNLPVSTSPSVSC